ncbi:MAG: F0F1 ATP synthase subunit alpha, partial [Methyloceanibacter sp.]
MEMNPLRDDIATWLVEARRRLRALDVSPTLEHVGIVEHVGDGVAVISGLPSTRLDELLRFADGTLGLAFRVDENSAGCVLLGAG